MITLAFLTHSSPPRRCFAWSDRGGSAEENDGAMDGGTLKVTNNLRDRARTQPVAPLPAVPNALAQALKASLRGYFGGAEIVFASAVRWQTASAWLPPGGKGQPVLSDHFSGSLFPSPTRALQVYNEDGRGSVDFSWQPDQSQPPKRGSVKITAWLKASLPTRKIYPGEGLSEGLFRVSPVEVTQGLHRSLRHQFFPLKEPLTGFLAHQTLLEGQPLLLSAVKKKPDIERGAHVQVEMRAGLIKLMTEGFAEEPGYFEKDIHVRTLSRKKQLLGKLKAGGVVEVRL